MPTYLKNTPGSQSLGRQRSRATPGNKICNNVFCQLNEIVGINNNVCTFLVLSVLSVLVNLCSTVEGGGGDLLERVDVAGTSLHNRDRSFLRDRGLGRDRGFPLYHLHRECHQSGANN